MKYGETYEQLLTKLRYDLGLTSVAPAQYPHWWNTTITLYNKYMRSDNTIAYSRHVLNNVFYKAEKAEQLSGSALYQASSYIVRIPQDPAYIPHSQFVQQPEESLSNYFTLNTGDLVFKGEIDEEIDETVRGVRANDLLNKYMPDCFTVKTFSDNTGAAVARHYYISGV